MADNQPPKDAAAGRFWLLQLIRLGGVMMAVAGAMILADALHAPTPLGVVLLVAGVIEYFFVPAILARSWKSRDQ